MAKQSMSELFESTLRDVYWAEKAIVKSLPKLAKKVDLDEVRSAMLEHVEQTKGQVERLEKVFEILGVPARGKECKAMKGLLSEGEEIASEFEGPALTAGLIGANQAVEHYEIARYGTLCAWAEEIGQDDCVELLEQTLEEEKQTDQKLTELAERLANSQAVEAEGRSASSGMGMQPGK